MFKLFAALGARLKDSRKAQAEPTPGVSTKPGRQSGTASRKQLLAVVLKETLIRHKVPPNWLTMEYFRTMSRNDTRNSGIHVRLVLREGHQELPARMMALEQDFRRRVTLIDYRAAEWLQGVTWQFELPEEPEATEPPRATPALAEGRPLRVPRRDEAREWIYASTEPAPL